MRFLCLIFIAVFGFGQTSSAVKAASENPGLPDALQNLAEKYETAAQLIRSRGLGATTAHDFLADLTEKYPRRISGSKRLEDAIAWLKTDLENAGMKVRLQEVEVPRWIRGKDPG